MAGEVEEVMMDRLGWAAVGLFVAFKIAVLGSFAFEQVTGRVPQFDLGFISPAEAYQITLEQGQMACRSEDDHRMLQMAARQGDQQLKLKLLEVVMDGRCLVLKEGEIVDKVGGSVFDVFAEVLRFEDGQRYFVRMDMLMGVGR